MLSNTSIAYEPSTYILVFKLKDYVEAKIRGRQVTLPPGLYSYIGSAGQGLLRRVCRHVKGARKKRWHIDYVTSSPHYQPIALIYCCRRWGTTIENCIATRLCSLYECVKGFGSTDDRRAYSHLVYFSETRPTRLFPILLNTIRECGKCKTYGLLYSLLDSTITS